ncbi:MAG: 50S ribosomal protein L32e [Thermoplasmata archaeon]
MNEEKKAKKVERKTEPPTVGEINKARKAELIEMCKSLGLATEGTVPELRKRLKDHLKEAEEKEEEIEIVEEEAARPKLKPVLDDETKKSLALRKRQRSKRPKFRRQEWFRYGRLGDSWRRPRGLHSKMRRGLKYRPKMVSIGYRSPRKARGLHPSGFEEIVIHNKRELEALDPKKQAARIGHSVGTRKRVEIESRADEIGIRILNRSMIHEPEKSTENGS